MCNATTLGMHFPVVVRGIPVPVRVRRRLNVRKAVVGVPELGVSKLAACVVPSGANTAEFARAQGAAERARSPTPVLAETGW
jgi:hypothetical protein